MIAKKQELLVGGGPFGVGRSGFGEGLGRLVLRQLVQREGIGEGAAGIAYAQFKIKESVSNERA